MGAVKTWKYSSNFYFNFQTGLDWAKKVCLLCIFFIDLTLWMRCLTDCSSFSPPSLKSDHLTYEMFLFLGTSSRVAAHNSIRGGITLIILSWLSTERKLDSCLHILLPSAEISNPGTVTQYSYHYQINIQFHCSSLPWVSLSRSESDCLHYPVCKMFRYVLLGTLVSN